MRSYRVPLLAVIAFAVACGASNPDVAATAGGQQLSTTRLADIPASAHILWPAKASGFPLAEATALCRELQKSSLEVLNDCSAFGPMETPDLLVRSLKHWLDGELAENLPT